MGRYQQILTVCCMTVMVAGCSDSGGHFYTFSDSRIIMGTVVDITAVHSRLAHGRGALQMAFAELARIDSLLSVHNPGSEMARINDRAGVGPAAVSAETFAIMERARGYSERFQDAFDITIGALAPSWGFNTAGEIAVPDADEVSELLPLVDWRLIVLDPESTTVFLPRTGMKIDLGGIAKGYGIDRAAQVLKKQGVKRFLINAGGDLFASGLKSVDSRWRVGLQHPRKKGPALMATLELTDQAIATSGDYQRYKLIDGRRVHHILDPRSGAPSRASQSVSVVAGGAEEADVLATALFVYGQERIRDLKLDDIAYFLVDSEGGRHISEAFHQQLAYRLMD